MFGIGMPELIMILIVALIVFGPKKLPELAQSLGRALGEFKRATNDLKQSIQTETGLDEVRKSLREADLDMKESLAMVDQAGAAAQPAAAQPETAAAAGPDAPPQDPMADVRQAFDHLNAENRAPAEETEAAATKPNPGTPSTHE